ncbi:MAG: response regulator [Magnetospirillum sp.]|nr:response regulator [Magnetospirillum sp.]
MDSLNVLIVDDSLITVKKLTVMLDAMGHQVVGTANCGEKALPAYRTLRPDLVTMDITMPGMDGVSATRQIVAEFPHAAIIMVTSHGQERMVIDALDAGACGYVLKPIRPEKLADMVAKAMKRREPGSHG